MKILTTFSGKEYILEDNEAENIKEIFKPNELISLRNGEAVNTSAIESIGSPELVPYWKEYLLDKSGKSFIRDGRRIFLETQDFENIEYKLSPKYKAMELAQNIKLLNKKNGQKNRKKKTIIQ